jgi:hypothetical protein
MDACEAPTEDMRMNPWITLGRWLSKSGRMAALYERGLAKAKRGDLPGAIEDFTAVIISPTAPPEVKALAYIDRAAAFSRLGNGLEAEEDLESVLFMPGAPAGLRSTAKERLAEYKRRASSPSQQRRANPVNNRGQDG